MNQEIELRREIRHNNMFQRLGTDSPFCVDCGEDYPAALIPTHFFIICYEFLLRDMGRPTTEEHHVAGRHNDGFALPLAANDHRVASDFQKDWPEKTFLNPNSSCLRANAARVRGLADFLLIVSLRTITGIIKSLIETNDRLERELGPDWWKKIG